MNLIKKSFIFFLLTFSIISVLFSQTKEDNIPPKESDALSSLEKSPRHGEWITYSTDNNDKVNAWIVYPERKDKAPVVVVIHEIFGLSDWIRAVTDQLASEGFIAIAPDFLSGKVPGGNGSKGLSVDAARAINSKLDPIEVVQRLNGAIKYATSLPSAQKKYGVVGFCWGGTTSFLYATKQPGLSAAVVYYGTSPSKDDLAGLNVPVLGLYGGNDNRVNATIQAAEDEISRLKKSYEKEIYSGAGHGFLRQQDGQDGSNLKAAKLAWPKTIQFFKKNLEIKLKSTGDTNKENIITVNTVSPDCCDP